MDLAERRKALLAKKLRATGIAEGEAGIPHRSRPDRAPLSYAQQHAWAHQHAAPDSAANNLCLSMRAEGPLDLDALRGAFEEVVHRHEVLRTTYHADPEGTPYQRIHEELPPPVTVLDLPEGARLRELIRDAAAEPFDLAAEGPLRLWFVRHEPRVYTILLVIQHIVWDGMTLAVLSADLRECYTELCSGTLPPQHFPRPQYADYAEWQRSAELSGVEREYWHARLEPPAPALALPYRGDAAEPADEAGARVDRRLARIGGAELRTLAGRHATTPFAVFLACYAEVLHRYCGGPEFTIGTLAVDREEPGLGALAGNFANPITLRLDLTGRTGFAERLGLVQAECGAAFTRRGYPYPELARELAGEDGSGRVPFFDTLVVFVATDIEGPQLPGVSLDWRREDTGAAQFPLVPLGVEVFVRAEGIDVQLTYQTGLLERAAVVELLDELEAELCATVSGRVA